MKRRKEKREEKSVFLGGRANLAKKLSFFHGNEKRENKTAIITHTHAHSQHTTNTDFSFLDNLLILK
jgi:hypothetical protein